MTKTKSILLTLKPVDYYFFGGENTFDSDPERRNYLVHSNHLPQQTGILGLLRHVLFQAGLNIGDTSFDPQNPSAKFGLIEALSPLFMHWQHQAKRHFFYPASQLHLDAAQAELTVDTQKTKGQGIGLLSAKWEDLPQVLISPDEAYSEKKYLNETWVSTDATALKIPAKVSREKLAELNVQNPENGIFYSSLHIGIDKASRMQAGGGDENGFYKQEFYRLAPGFSFAVKVDFTEDINLSIFPATMPFGGESRQFILGAEPWLPTFATQHQQFQFAYPYSDERIVLLSDAYISQPDWQKIIQDCSFVATDVKPFRNAQWKAAHYKNQSSSERRRTFANFGPARSKTLLHLLKRGSVLFPKAGKQQSVLAKTGAAQHFCTIGYNHTYPSHPSKSETK